MDADERAGLPPGMAVSITVIRGPDVGTKFQMSGQKVLVGRKRGDVLLRDRETSGIHASIEQAPDGTFILRDLGSTNGTYLDGRRLTVGEIQSGQQIRIGSNYLLFTVVAESASDTTRHANPAITGPHSVPASFATPEGAFGRTSVSARDAAFPPPRSRGGLLDADLGEPDLSGMSGPSRRDAPTAASPRRAPDEIPARASQAPHASPPSLPDPAAPAWAGGAWAAGAVPAAPPLAVTQPVERRPPAGRAPEPAPPPAPAASDEGLPPGVERSIYGVYLLVERGKDRGRVFPINRQVTVLGRSGTEILINDQDISRRHAAIDVQGNGKYILRDLASTNGTLLNGVRVQTEAIQANDKIRVGGTTIKLLVGDDRVVAEMRRLAAEAKPA